VSGTFLAGTGCDCRQRGSALTEVTVLSNNFLGSGLVATITTSTAAAAATASPSTSPPRRLPALTFTGQPGNRSRGASLGAVT